MTSDNPANRAIENDISECVKRAMQCLTAREREIIKLRYGLGDGYTYTLEEVGRIFNVTRECVRQIEAKAIRKLQKGQPGQCLKCAKEDLDALKAETSGPSDIRKLIASMPERDNKPKYEQMSNVERHWAYYQEKRTKWKEPLDPRHRGIA